MQHPAARSQILMVRSAETEANSRASAENATKMTESLWPSNVWRHAFQFSSTVGFVTIQSGSSALYCFLTKLPRGENTRADV